jgi:DNA polymerase-3 subunit gamma/tau
LFTGPAGCGKTTAARILANDINESKGSPIEVDAASNSGVENVRDIIEHAKKKSIDSEYKVYIIDECHSLSNSAWQALLKLLEEPPKTTIFIMCTTDPSKIPATILSRVQRYDFSKISLKSIIDRLIFIIREERYEFFGSDGADLGDPPDYEFQPEAIQYIAKLADGGMRSAITMLDKCLSLSTEITVENVVSALGTVDYNVYFNLLMRLTTGDSLHAVEVVETVYQAGKDLKNFIKQFQYFVVDVCKYKMFNNFQYITIPELPEYKTGMEDENYDDVIKVLEWVRQLNVDIKWESNPKAIIETSIMLFAQEE